MTFEEYKNQTGKHWHIIAAELTGVCHAKGVKEHIYLNRLNRLRAGSPPMSHELMALMILTKNKVESFK